MFKKLLLLFVIVPAVELYLLIQIGDLVGFWPTIGLIVFTGVIGSALAKQEGIATLNRIQSRLRTGQLPGNELIDGALLLVAGAFLVTPGILTDLTGLLLLIPMTRKILRHYLKQRLKKAISQGKIQVSGTSFTAPSATPDVEDAEWEAVS